MIEKPKCPYSGLTIFSCKVSDICDCFDFPEHDAEAQEAIDRIQAVIDNHPTYCPRCHIENKPCARHCDPSTCTDQAHQPPQENE